MYKAQFVVVAVGAVVAVNYPHVMQIGLNL